MPFLAARTERGMSRHEGVSCDACLRSNFRGRRYKCLICYDYDLCAGCHEAGSTTTRHTADHPMQCILTRSDAEVLYGGEALPLEQPRSFVCPHCGRMGFTETSLADHVSAQHSDSVTQVVCPVCASVPSGEPNHITEDLPTHLTVDHHRGGGGGGLSARDLISFGDEPAPAGRQSARRVPHPAQAGGAPRIRRFNTHFRESMDPITELLSQLSGVRRAATLVSGGGPSVGAIGTGTASRLQQLQAQAVRQRGERPARRQPAAAGSSADGSTVAPPAAEAAAAAAAPRRQETGSSGASASDGPQFLLASILDDDDSELAGRQVDRADRSAFVQEVILSTLIDSMDASSICESGGRPAASAAAAASAPSSALATQPSSQKGRDARPAAAAAAAAGGPPARVTPPAAGASPVGAVAAAAAARPAAVASRLPAAARPGRGAPQLRASGLVHHPVGVSVAGVRGQRKPPRPAAAAAAAAVDGRPAEPSAH